MFVFNPSSTNLVNLKGRHLGTSKVQHYILKKVKHNIGPSLRLALSFVLTKTTS